jgi:hypothetical protein
MTIQIPAKGRTPLLPLLYSVAVPMLAYHPHLLLQH